MSSNETMIRRLYANAAREDGRATSSRANGLEFHYTAKLAGQYIGPSSSVIEIGCGTGYYGVHFADRCKEYVGVDLSQECIDMFNEKIESGQLPNVHAMVGDATRLDGIEDSRFDVVMALGPMYHLPPDERDLVFAQCKRVCRSGGMIMMAYVSKVGVYVKGCLEFPDRYPDKQLTRSVLKDGMSDEMRGLFYFSMPEEMELQAKSHGLSLVRHAGVDFVFNEKIINAMSEEQFEAWLDLADLMFESPSCTGLSNHSIVVFRKG
jgi:ubiquinone/menaquinone biosynthesis C-methylase UbiE